MPDPTPAAPVTTTTARVRLYRILGVVVVVGVSIGSAMLAPRFPWVGPIAAIICWYVGKLLGIPTNEIIAAALAKKDPTQIAQIAMSAITAMPVESISMMATKVMNSLRPIAEGRVSVQSIPPPSAIPTVAFVNVELDEMVEIPSATGQARDEKK